MFEYNVSQSYQTIHLAQQATAREFARMHQAREAVRGTRTLRSFKLMNLIRRALVILTPRPARPML
ncbi:MAG TPA: hypothetical protein VD902_20590 [Symbiobacteriaceae bacterium]|nr:hypothetical protein [Symbiobacteriaceae bacterium]